MGPDRNDPRFQKLLNTKPDPTRFFAELKRRKVYSVAVAYIVAAPD